MVDSSKGSSRKSDGGPKSHLHNGVDILINDILKNYILTNTMTPEDAIRIKFYLIQHPQAKEVLKQLGKDPKEFPQKFKEKFLSDINRIWKQLGEIQVDNMMLVSVHFDLKS